MGWEAVSHIRCDALFVLVGVVGWGLCASLYTSLCEQAFASGPKALLKAKSALFLKRRKSSQEAGTLDPFLQMCVYVCAKLLQSSLSLCDFMDCSSPGSSVRGILQARVLEWVVMRSFRGSS